MALKKRNVYLTMVAWHLFFIAFRMHRSSTDFPSESIPPMTFKNPLDRGIANADIVIALQVPDHSDRTQVIDSS